MADLAREQINKAQDAVRISCKWYPIDEECQRCDCECPIDYSVRLLETLLSDYILGARVPISTPEDSQIADSMRNYWAHLANGD